MNKAPITVDSNHPSKRWSPPPGVEHRSDKARILEPDCLRPKPSSTCHLRLGKLLTPTLEDQRLNDSINIKHLEQRLAIVNTTKGATETMNTGLEVSQGQGMSILHLFF